MPFITKKRRNFEQMEEERTKVLISMEKQKVAEKEAETQKKIAISEAEKYAHVSKIQMEQKLMEKESVRKQEEIANTIYMAREKSEEIANAIYMAREKSLADASFYRTVKEAEANKLKLTPQYLELKFIEAITNNSKIFFGNKIFYVRVRRGLCTDDDYILKSFKKANVLFFFMINFDVNLVTL